MRRPLPLAAIVAACMVSFAAFPCLASNGAMPTTVGTKGPVSLPMDGDGQSFFRMPSSIGWSLGHRIDLSVFLLQSTARMRNRLNDFDAEDPTPGATLGFVFAPDRPDQDDDTAWKDYSEATKLTFGAGVFVDMAGGGGGGSDVRYQTYPETVELGSGISFLNLTLTTSFTPTKWLAIGASIHVIYASLELKTLVGGDSTPLNGSPTINGVALPGNPTYSDFLDLFGNDQATDPTTIFEGDLKTVMFSGTISVSLLPMDNLGIGLSYRFQTGGPAFSGEGEVNAQKTFSEALGPLPQGIQTQFLATLPNGGSGGFINEYDVEVRGPRVPRQVRLSVAWWPVDWLLVAGEIAWIEWASALRETEVELTSGNNQDLNFVIGSNSVDSNIKQRWRNQWVFSLFAQADIKKVPGLSFRMGFNYGKIPINEDYQGNSPSSGYTDTHLLFGGGYKFQTIGLELGFLVEHAFYQAKRSGGTESTPTARFTSYASRQWWFHVGVGYAF